MKIATDAQMFYPCIRANKREFPRDLIRFEPLDQELALGSGYFSQNKLVVITGSIFSDCLIKHKAQVRHTR